MLGADAMSLIPVYSIVAYSNTGKTTLLEKLIPELKSRGFRTAVIKHDAHEFEIDREGKDSWRLTKAGAEVTVVASKTKAVIMENRFEPIEELIDRIRDVDIIRTEGYKHGPWPKIALQRSEAAAAAAPAGGMPGDYDGCAGGTKTPCLGLNDISALADIIVEMYENKNRKILRRQRRTNCDNIRCL